MRWAVRAGSALLLAAAGIAGPGGVVLRAPAACAAAAAGTTRVAFAVDFGGAPGAPSSGVVLTCVPASGSAADALQARAQQLGTAAPRYASSGLLCAIDGYPASGCGVRTSSGYAYWSYWHGSGNGWSYATGGPAGWQVAPGDLEGWRFQDPGTGTAADPPPRTAPDESAICPPVAPPTTPPTTPPSAPPPTSGADTTAPPSGRTITPATSRVASAPSNRPATLVTTTTVPGSVAPVPPPSVATASSTVTTGAPTAAGRTGVALSPTPSSRGRGNGPPWSLLIGGLAALLLGGAAWWRMRRPAGAA